MELNGIVKRIGNQEEYNGFRKRELVLITGESEYPQILSVEFVQDKCKSLDYYKEGDSVRVKINLRGREWTNPEGVVKVFNSIQGWYIEEAGKTPEAAPANEEVDDMPF